MNGHNPTQGVDASGNSAIYIPGATGSAYPYTYNWMPIGTYGAVGRVVISVNGSNRRGQSGGNGRQWFRRALDQRQCAGPSRPVYLCTSPGQLCSASAWNSFPWTSLSQQRRPGVRRQRDVVHGFGQCAADDVRRGEDRPELRLYDQHQSAIVLQRRRGRVAPLPPT